MTDFDKLREAAEEIRLDDLQKQRILEACRGKKRKRINYAALAAVAAVLVVTVVMFSPGFLMKAGAPADSAENEMAVEDFLIADEEVNFYSDKVISQNSGNSGNGDGKYTYTVDECTHSVFNADGFRSIYSVIPQHFINLVSYEDFIAWSASAVSDDGMAIVQFVEHFGIPKEDFDRANRDYAKHIYNFYGTAPLYKTSDKEHEIYEIFDTELIYSFDRAKIDEHYEAFAGFDSQDSGTGSHSMPCEIIVPEEYYK